MTAARETCRVSNSTPPFNATADAWTLLRNNLVALLLLRLSSPVPSSSAPAYSGGKSSPSFRFPGLKSCSSASAGSTSHTSSYEKIRLPRLASYEKVVRPTTSIVGPERGKCRHSFSLFQAKLEKWQAM